MIIGLILALWWIVYGYGYPADVRGGPFSSFSECNQAVMTLGYPYHCEIR